MTPGIRALVLSGSCFVMAAAGLGLRAQEKPANSPDQPVSFNRDIRPILSNNCFACHGPDEDKREDASFHFDTDDGAFAKSGVIVPGNAAESLLVQRITSPDPDERMPPPESGHTLTPSRSSAAPMDRRGREVGHALGVRRRRSVPTPPRRVSAGLGPQSDRSVHPRAARREGLKPSPEADKATLLRRRHVRPDRPAADARGDRRLPRRPVARRLREAGGRAAAVAALRRAHGDAVARRRPLRRHARLPHRQPPRDVAVARLGHRRLQPQHAVRRVHDRAARRRPAARTPRSSRRSPPASTATT